MVSIIIPNFNHAQFLEQRIDSVLLQTYQDFELILLDDCSTDNSKEIIERYCKNSKVSNIVYNEKNSGSTFKQWETGLTLAKGEYIWIAESDDWAEPTLLKTLVNKLESDNHIGLVYCDSYVYELENTKTTFSKKNNTFMKMNKWSYDYNIEGHKEMENLSNVCTINNASAVLFRSEALKSVFPMKYFFRFMGDWFTYLNIAKSYRIAYIATPLNNYRYHPSNVSKQVNSNLSYLRERFIICHFILSECQYLDRKKQINNLYDYSVHKVSLKQDTLKVYRELYSMNPKLLFVLIKYNLIIPLRGFLKKIKRISTIKDKLDR